MSKIVGDFRLSEKLGRGTYADVYKGENMKTGRIYAVKKILKSGLTNPKLVAGLENEIKIGKELVHENIVRLYDSFSSERNFYLISELCSGGDLHKFIKSRGHLEERLAQSFLAQLLDGLKFLKDGGYIHRDLKPANVLLSEFSNNAVLKLADFGYARLLEGATLAMTSCGTPLYMPPEILEARSYDSRADVWSVGCIFFEMLTGIPPFNGTSQGDLLNNIKTKELTVPKGIAISKTSVEILIKVCKYPITCACSLFSNSTCMPFILTRMVHLN
jgi:serine/threonine-protein kinase ULK/ATG1